MTAQSTRDQRDMWRQIATDAGDDPHVNTLHPEEVLALLDHLDQAEARIEAVREMHNADGVRWVGFPRADEQVTYCTYCQERSPCTTIRTLDGEE